MASAPKLEEVIPEVGQGVSVDEAVIEKLPPGVRVLGASSWGTSLWTRTAKIVTAREDGSTTNYFLKCATGDNGKTMMNGEFESMTAIWTITPSFCPKPIAWGAYKNTPSTYFFLCEFVEFEDVDSPPPPEEFCSMLADMHKRGTSPNGKFGFQTTTCNGSVPQENSWTDTWEEFFAVGFKHMLRLDEATNGKSEELASMSNAFFGTVIPRLLRPLESDGRKVKPSLLHGDLWCGNAAITAGTGKPMVFDSCAFYGHHEYELGNWRPVRNKFNRSYKDAYVRSTSGLGISQPEADFDDRNALYSMRFNLHASILFPGATKFRAMVVDEMRRLVKKFSA